MNVLGIEGTAWSASAAIYTDDTDEVWIESDPYQPETGGIDPREAADHMATAIPSVVESALEYAREEGDRPAEEPPVDYIAFSRGPGLGPCLRIVATAARALAATLDVPLVGVNHMVAHLEVGRHVSGFDQPVCLNASGANAHVLGYHDGRYRVLGETMDTGIGNALDKFARHLGWSHPGGPKVEKHAADGEYVELPYVVKGMDFSFAGIVTNAQDAVDAGTPVDDVCFGLQETVFAMVTEVTERALSLTGADEVVLGGGVAQNARLRSMVETMARQRGASVCVPERRFLRDNAGMIAILGAKMATAGDTLEVEEATVHPDYRPDEVPVTWRSGASVARTGTGLDAGDVRGAEALLERTDEGVRKTRKPKEYRHEQLDARLRRERTAAEARLTSEARRAGVPTPVIRDLDIQAGTIIFEHVGDCDLTEAITTPRLAELGGALATCHDAGIIHGDPTPRNVRVAPDEDRLYLIDFGLGFASDHVEDRAMDLHVLDQSLSGTAADIEPARAAIRDGYVDVAVDFDQGAVLDRLAAIETRGRYQ